MTINTIAEFNNYTIFAKLTPEIYEEYEDQFIDVYNSAFTEDYLDDESYNYIKEILTSAINDPNFYGLYIKKNEKIIGFAIGQKFLDYKTYYLDRLAVFPNRSNPRLDLGGDLLRLLEKNLIEQGITSLQFETDKAINEKFYKKILGSPKIASESLFNYSLENH